MDWLTAFQQLLFYTAKSPHSVGGTGTLFYQGEQRDLTSAGIEILTDLVLYK